MVRRFICAVVCLLAVGAACRAQQETAPTIPAPQPSKPVESFNSPELDAYAAKLVEKIKASNASSVVVVGGSSLDNKVSELGVSLRDGLNEAFARQAAGFLVISTSDVTEILKRNRVSARMIYCNLASEWISAYSRADVAVVLRLERVENGHAVIRTEIWNEPTTVASNQHANVFVPDARIDGLVTLSDAQINSATLNYNTAVKIHAAKTGKEGIRGLPNCVYCPRPEYTEIARQAWVHAVILAEVTVRPDGKADDILILRPVGFGLDSMAINTLLTWMFKPAVDAQNNPVATRVPIELAFALN